MQLDNIPKFPSTLQEILKFALETEGINVNNYHLIAFYESYIDLNNIEVIDVKVIVNMKKVICLNSVYDINPSITLQMLYYNIFCKISKNFRDVTSNLN